MLEAAKRFNSRRLKNRQTDALVVGTLPVENSSSEHVVTNRNTPVKHSAAGSTQEARRKPEEEEPRSTRSGCNGNRVSFQLPTREDGSSRCDDGGEPTARSPESEYESIRALENTVTADLMDIGNIVDTNLTLDLQQELKRTKQRVSSLKLFNHRTAASKSDAVTVNAGSASGRPDLPPPKNEPTAGSTVTAKPAARVPIALECSIRTAKNERIPVSSEPKPEPPSRFVSQEDFVRKNKQEVHKISEAVAKQTNITGSQESLGGVLQTLAEKEKALVAAGPVSARGDRASSRSNKAPQTPPGALEPNRRGWDGAPIGVQSSDHQDVALEMLRQRRQAVNLQTQASTRPLSSPGVRTKTAGVAGTQLSGLPSIVTLRRPESSYHPPSSSVTSLGNSGLPSIAKSSGESRRIPQKGAAQSTEDCEEEKRYMHPTSRAQLANQIHEAYKSKIAELKKQFRAESGAVGKRSGLRQRGLEKAMDEVNADILEVMHGDKTTSAVDAGGGEVGKVKKKKKKKRKKRTANPVSSETPVEEVGVCPPRGESETCPVGDKSRKPGPEEVVEKRTKVAPVQDVSPPRVIKAPEVHESPAIDRLTRSITQNAMLSNEEWLNQLMSARKSHSMAKSGGCGELFYNHQTGMIGTKTIEESKVAAGDTKLEVKEKSAAVKSKPQSGRYRSSKDVTKPRKAPPAPAELVRAMMKSSGGGEPRPRTVDVAKVVSGKKSGGTKTRGAHSDIPKELVLPDFGEKLPMSDTLLANEMKHDEEANAEVCQDSNDAIIFDLNSGRGVASSIAKGEVVSDGKPPGKCGERESVGGKVRAVPSSSVHLSPRRPADSKDALGRVVCAPHGITECTLCELRRQSENRVNSSSEVVPSESLRTGTTVTVKKDPAPLIRSESGTLRPSEIITAMLSGDDEDGCGATIDLNVSPDVVLGKTEGDPGLRPVVEVCKSPPPDQDISVQVFHTASEAQSPIKIDIRNSYMKSRPSSANNTPVRSKTPVEKFLQSPIADLLKGEMNKSPVSAGVVSADKPEKSDTMGRPGVFPMKETNEIAGKPTPAPASLGFFDITSTADKGRYIVNRARDYVTSSISRKPDILAPPRSMRENSDSADESVVVSSASPGIMLLCGRHKESGHEHILTVLFDRTVFKTEESAAVWWKLNQPRLAMLYK